MTRILILALCAFGAVALLCAAACSGSERVSREEVLVSLTNDLIVPRFQDVAERMEALRSSTRALCAQPSTELLEDARGAWRDAREPWLRSQAMWFGPIMDRRSRSLVDWSPVEPERIEGTLSKRDSVDADIIREFLSSTQRGLGAVEYVLFQDGPNGLDALDVLGEPGSIRCQYLTALADVVAEETAAALNDWTGENAEGISYAGYFNGTAKSSLIGKAAVDEAVRTSIFLSRIIVDMGLGKALGIADSIPDISGIPGGAGHNQVADIRNQLLGMRDIYLGADGGLGISALVRGASAESDDRVIAAFDSAIAAVEGLSEPLPSTIRDDPETTRKAYDALKELQTTLNTDVVSVLSVTVGFADTDGDGG